MFLRDFLGKAVPSLGRSTGAFKRAFFHPFSVIGLMFLFVGGSLLLVAAAKPANPQAASPKADEDEGWDDPLAREQRFMENRTSPDSEPAASHRFRAAELARQMTGITAGGGRRNLGNGMRRPDNIPGAGNSDWQEIGPNPENAGAGSQGTPPYGNISGRVTSLAVDPSNSNNLFIGTAFGGLWKMAGSNSAQLLSDPQLSMAVGSFAVDPTDDNNIYVGTGEPNEGSSVYYGMGILKTTTGGTPWTLVSTASGPNGPVSLAGMSFSKILVDPKQTNILLAGATSVNPKRIDGLTSLPLGLFQSTDSGASWTFVTKSTAGFTINGTDFSNNACTDIVYDPFNATYYAAFRGTGIYKSTNQGSTWTQLPDPFPSGTAPDANVMDRASLAVNQGTVYALITSSPFVSTGANPLVPSPGAPSAPNSSKGDTGLAQLMPGASAWAPINLPPVDGSTESYTQEYYDQYLAVPPGGGLAMGILNVHFAPTVSGTSTQWRTLENWEIGTIHADQHAIAFSSATTWFVGCDGGVWTTNNATSTSPQWTDLNQGLGTIQYYSVSPDFSAPNVFFAGAQDNGTVKTSGTALLWNQVFGGDGGLTDSNPAQPTQYFSEADNTDSPPHFVLFASTNSGAGWGQLSPTFANFSDNTNFPAPFKVIPGNPATILYGTTRLWTGLGDGSQWGFKPSNFTGNPNGAFFVPNVAGNYVYALEDAPANNPQVIYLSTIQRFDSTGNNRLATPIFKVFKTSDFTNWNWTDITGSLPGRPFSCIAADPNNPSNLYVSAQGFNAGHVFNSQDGGTTWNDITGDLPDAPANWLLIDPQETDHLYVATDVGVFVTQNQGAHWDKLGNSLPDTAVLQIKMAPTQPRVIVAATHGRGAWTIPPVSGSNCYQLASIIGCDSSFLNSDKPCPTGTANGQFSGAAGVASVPNSPVLYVLDSNRVQKFNINGTWLATIQPGGSFTPLFAAADSQGNLYVTDLTNLVDVYDSNQNFLFSFDGSSSGTKFFQIGAVAVDPQGNVFVADGGNARVAEFKPNLSAKTAVFLTQIGTKGSGNGQFVHPFELALDATGANLYVGDLTPRVQKFSIPAPGQTPVFATSWNISTGTWADNSKTVVSDSVAGSMGVGKDGNIYVNAVVTANIRSNNSDDFVNNVQVFDPNGDFLWEFAGGLSFGGNNNVQNFVFDNCGDLFTSDFTNNRVDVYRTCGSSCGPTDLQAGQLHFLDLTINVSGGPAGGVVLTDVLPAGESFVSASTTPASVNGNTVTWNLGTLPVGTTTITVTVQANGSVPSGTTMVNLPSVSSTSGFVSAQVNPFNVVSVGAGTLTPTPTPCLARVTSPNLDLRIKRIQCNNNLVAYRVFVQDNDSVPVKLSDLTVKLWAFDTGITNWQLDNNFTGLLFGNGVNGTTVDGSIGMKALPFSPACTTDPSHKANWEFDVASTSSMTIPAGGGYWISGDFGIHPVGYNPPFTPGLSSWFSQAPNGVCGDTGSSNDPTTYYDDPHYALYFQGQLVAEKGGTDPNTGTVPCALLCPPPPTATFTPTVPCTPVAGQPSPNLDLKVRMIQCNTNDQAVFRVFVRNNDPAVAVKLSDLTVKMWTYDTTAAGFKLNNYFNGNINGNVFNGNGTLFQGVTSPFQLATVPMTSPCLSNPGHSANFELDITNNSSQTLPVNGGYFIDGDFGIQRSDAEAFVPGISQWYSQIPAGEGTSCSDTSGNNPAGYFDDSHYALFYQGQLVAEQGGTDANTGVVPCLCMVALPKSGSSQGQAVSGTPTATPTISPTPSTTPFLGRELSVAAEPNVSRNGEPVRFLVNLDRPAQVKLALFTLTGEQVYTASIQGGVGENALVWPLENQAGDSVASGLYLYEVEIEDSTGTTKKTGKVAILH